MLGRYPATLAWHVDNTISLVIASTDQTLFRCRPNDTAWFRVYPGHAKIKLTDGRKYKFVFDKDFHESLNRGMAAGVSRDFSRSDNVLEDFFLFRNIRIFADIVNAFFTIKMYKSDVNSDAGWWVMILKASGVRTLRVSAIKLTLLLAAVFFTVPVVIALYITYVK